MTIDIVSQLDRLRIFPIRCSFPTPCEVKTELLVVGGSWAYRLAGQRDHHPVYYRHSVRTSRWPRTLPSNFVSYHCTTVPGFLGWASFHFYRASSFCTEPSIPPRLFKNRTSAAGLSLAIISSKLLQNVTNIMLVYFQTGIGTLDAGINFLPEIIPKRLI